MWIRDIFYSFELPRKINIWSGFIIASPYLGPFMASFVVWGLDWRWAYWIYAILNYIGLVLILFFADETFYDRRLSREQQPAWKSRPLRILGVERHGTYNLVEAVSRPFIAILKLPVLIITVFYFLNFAWTIGVNATLATWLAKYYHFDGKQTGLFYFAPIVGCVLGAVSGHWVHGKPSIGDLPRGRANMFQTQWASGMRAAMVARLTPKAVCTSCTSRLALRDCSSSCSAKLCRTSGTTWRWPSSTPASSLVSTGSRPPSMPISATLTPKRLARWTPGL